MEPETPIYGLGIDAGGTYTDAVIFDFSTQKIVAKAKSLTTRDDYSLGVALAIGKLPHELVKETRLVSLSTTLATNAIVEGKGCKVGAVVIGFDHLALERIPHQPIRAIEGRMDITGHPMTQLDEKYAELVLRELLEKEQVGAIAVSGMCSVMNPEFEIRVQEIARRLTDKPVICAHEMSMQLDSIKRTITTTLNARLLPIIAELIVHVKQVMEKSGIHAPLMVVRGDGTLMSEEMARRSPVETVLSGPAASVCGAQFLAGIPNGLIVDIGGTTSDIALIIDGNPVIAAKGARVAEWSTNVRAVDIETVGLGGDSAVAIGHEEKLLIGPKRAVPLCWLANEYPAILDELRRLWDMRHGRSILIQPAEFYLVVGEPSRYGVSEREARLLTALKNGPMSREQLAVHSQAFDPSLVPMSRLENFGCVQSSTLTLTDIFHYLGIFSAWNREAAVLGIKLFADRANMTVEELVTAIQSSFTYNLTIHLLHRLMRHQAPMPDFPQSAVDRTLLDMLAKEANMQGMTLQAQYENPLVAIGAPAQALAEGAAGKLGAQLVVPEHAEVANAVGAITGVVMIEVEATITPDSGRFIVHSPAAMREYNSIEEAKSWAAKHVEDLLDEQITIGNIEGFSFHRELHTEDKQGDTGFGTVFLECRVRGTAVAKPEFAN